MRMLELSFIELRRLVNEVVEIITNSRIDNIYQLEDGSIIFKILKEGSKYELRIIPGACLYLVSGEYEKPKTPTEKALRLRRLLNNTFIKEIELIEGERIITLKVSKKDKQYYKVIVELLPRGTLIVTDENNTILYTLEELHMRDRKIVVGEKYVTPPSRLTITNIENLEKILDSLQKEKKIVSSLAVDLGLGGRYAEETLHLAGIDKSKKISQLEVDEKKKLKESLENVFRNIFSGKPVVVKFRDKSIQPLPYMLHSIREEEVEEILYTENFCEAVRIAYEKTLAEKFYESRLEKIRDELLLIEKELRSKLETIEKLKQTSQSKKNLASIIMNYAKDLEELKTSGVDEITIGELKARLKREEKTIHISTPYGEIEISTFESIPRQASKIFDESKSIDKAIDKLEKEAEELKRKIENLEKSLEIENKIRVDTSIRKRYVKMKWYEKYRWFYTSEGFLAVAGKDASSNLTLIKKHMEDADLVFHAEVKGAPILILKNGVNAGEKSRLEAAQFAACYSRAWREELTYTTVYYVKPQQISLTPPQGHYLPRGGVIVKGEKNYLTVKLELAIGIRDNEIVWGPLLTIEGSGIRKYVKIVPGKKNAYTLALEIIKTIYGELDKQKYSELIEKITQIIPYGKGELVHSA